MWDFASVVERTRQAFASVSRLEAALARDPNSAAVQINLAASKKRALKSHAELQEIAEYNRKDICNYRLMPFTSKGYLLASVSKSWIEYQNLFSQIYDSIKNGAKVRAVIGGDAAYESALELAYTYSGSLGVVLFANNDRDFFEGKLDRSIDSLFSVLEVDSRSGAREVALTYGGAVIKRLHDWSRANIDGGFSTDMRWSRSDGRQLGRVFEIERMERLVELAIATSDETTTTNSFIGVLVGDDLNSGSFHFVVPGGEDFRGSLGQEFPPGTEMILGKQYAATIRETTTTVYATEKVDRVRELLSLTEPKRISQSPSQ